jgi:outer membrane receptor protein involved in Fe transport
MTTDFGLRREFLGVDLTAQLINAFDEEPPFSDAIGLGYDFIHSPVGRMYKLSATKRF